MAKRSNYEGLQENVRNLKTSKIETWENKYKDKRYVIRMETPEFTCICPKTGRPDFAVITIRYIPDASCVELKSLKYYELSFRNTGIFHENVVNRMLDDIAGAVKPRWMEIVGCFNARGGIKTTVSAEYNRAYQKPHPGGVVFGLFHFYGEVGHYLFQLLFGELLDLFSRRQCYGFLGYLLGLPYRDAPYDALYLGYGYRGGAEFIKAQAEEYYRHRYIARHLPAQPDPYAGIMAVLDNAFYKPQHGRMGRLVKVGYLFVHPVHRKRILYEVVSTYGKEIDLLRQYIAYNRRFYSSVQKAIEIINENGGALSFHFEFTEWIHKIPATKKTAGIIHEWFLANSTHVIDLAFFLCGKPKKLTGYALAGFPWHNGSSIFTGAGVTEKNALLSYHANWESAGRWGIEILTAKNRLYLRPLEKLSIQNIEEIDTANVIIDDTLDIKFKPGYYLQDKSFLEDKKNLPDIQEQIHMLAWYEKINQA